MRRPGRHRPDQVVAMHRNAWSSSPECAVLLQSGPAGLRRSEPEVLLHSQVLLPRGLVARPMSGLAAQFRLAAQFLAPISAGLQASVPAVAADRRSRARLALRRSATAARGDTGTAMAGRDMAIAQPMPPGPMLREPILAMLMAASILPEATATTSTGGQRAFWFAISHHELGPN